MSSVINASKKVRLSFKCNGLADLDTFSKSDPYVMLHEGRRTSPNSIAKGRVLGRTETIMNNLNPVFARTIEIDFQFEARQDLVIAVFDDDGKGPVGDDLCGEVCFQLSQVICSRGGAKTFPLVRDAARGITKGTIEVTFSDVCAASKRDSAQIGIVGKNLRKMSCLGSPNAYYVLSRLQPNGSKVPIFKSNVCKGTIEPAFVLTPQIPISHMLGSDEQQQILLLELFDDGLFSTTSMGVVKFSLADLKAAYARQTPLIPRKAKDISQTYGDLFVKALNLVQFPTFTQSLANGWQINMALSIDFTGSNGDPRLPNSLHFMNPSVPNQYVSAMMSVGDILLEYDTDKQIPVFGFGAAIGGVGGSTSHFFNVNCRADPYVSGIQGALDAYGTFLPTCALSGPTNFAPTIRNVAMGARKANTATERVYTVLLIITDGAITDMRQTVDALVEADDAPLSIVIVGVGNADFTSMEELDGDGVNLRASNGRISRRDLVQFVPYRDFLPPRPREALAAEVLREIPDQFEEYLVLASQQQGGARVGGPNAPFV